MTPEDLRAAIKVVDNQVTITDATLGSTAVTEILKTYGQSGTLTIEPAAVTSKDDDDFVLVHGTVTLLNVQVSGDVRFYLDGADAQIELTGTPPAGWRFGDSFASLKPTHFEQFVLANPSLRLLSKQKGDVPAGLVLNAGFTLPPVLEALRWFAAPDANATLSGPIALDAGEPNMTLTVGPTIRASLGSQLNIDLTMLHVASTYRTAATKGPILPASDDDQLSLEVTPPRLASADGEEPSQQAPSVAAISLLTGDVSFTHAGKNVSVPLQAAFNEQLGVLHLSVVTSDLFDLALSEISHWVGGVNLASDGLPESYRPLAGLTLQHVDFAIGLQTKSIEYIALTIGSTSPWHVLDDKIVVSGVNLEFMVMPGRTPALSASIGGTLSFDQAVTLDIFAQVPDFQIRGQLAEDSPVDLVGLIKKLGGVSAGLPNTLVIDELSFAAHPAGSSYSFAIDVEGDWDIVKGLKVEQLGARFSYEEIVLDVLFEGRFLIAGVDVSVSAEYDSEVGGWHFTGEAAQQKPIKVGDFVGDLAKQFSSTASQSLPEFITSLEIDHISVSFDTATNDFSFSCETRFSSSGTELDLYFEIELTNSGGGYTQVYGGVLMIGQHRFELYFEKIQTGDDAQTASSIFLAAVQPELGIDLRQLVTDIDSNAGELMPELTLTLENAAFIYRKIGTAPGDYLFTLALGVPLDLATLPLVGEVFHDSKLGSINDIQALYASAPFVADDVGTFNALLTQAGAKPALPLAQGATGKTPVFSKGFNVAATLTLGGNPTPLMAGGTTAPPTSSQALAVAAPPAPPSGNASWIDVKKSIGPVTLERIGVRYEDGRVWLLLDADFLLANLSLGLQGLALGFKLDDLKSIAVNLDGMSIDFQSGPLTIAGGFLRFGDDYLGMAQVKAATFGLTAIGGYAPKERSFFIFVRLNVPLGGPPFFFVTGIAGGFGVNRLLLLPPIDDLTKFVLLPANSTFPTKLDGSDPGQSLATTLASTEKFLSPSAGSNWVAAGIDFTSFEMVDASALVTVAFGLELQIALLGICRVTVPKLDPEPIVYLEIALEARFQPSEGLLAVDGRLTPASFLYAGLVKITGGFAFYLWFAGDHEGDFVISVGGYHPRFKKPDHYPVVPRLQLTYQLGALVIKGQTYLALTPHMVMAGLQLDATWKSGSISAWFSAGLDFLLGWRPFHYEADAYIHIGVSFTLDLLVTTVSITIHVGVDLSIWGPPFGGKATIDLDVISFTIYFGDDPRKEILDWAGFKSSFLPSTKATPAPMRTALFATPAARAAAPTVDPDGQLCTANVTDGLLTDLKAQDATSFFNWIVDTNHFAIQSGTLIPSKQATYNAFDLQTPFTADKGFKYTRDGQPDAIPAARYDTVKNPNGLSWTNQFGVLPMQLGPNDFQTHHTVQLQRTAEGADYTVPANYTQDVDNIAIEPMLKGASSALYAPSDPGLNGTRLVPNTLVGLRFSPMIQHPDITLKADLWSMLFDQSQQISWVTVPPAVDRSDTFEANVVDSTLTFTVAGASVTCTEYQLTALTKDPAATARTAVVSSLRDLGFDLTPDKIDVADLATYPLWDWPMIHSLGEEAPVS